MEDEFYKNEIINRYCYLYENSRFIFGYFMREETLQEYDYYLSLSNVPCSLYEYYSCDLNLLDAYTLYMLESLLLEDKPMEKTEGFKYLENLKKNKDKIKKGLRLKDEYNSKHKHNLLYFDPFKMLSYVYKNIDRQGNDFENKNKKLNILDDYIRISRYTNDGKTWSSGYRLNYSDNTENNPEYRLRNYFKDHSPIREHFDIGISNNNFINKIQNLKLSKEEIKSIYFKYHDEFDYNTEIICNQNDIYEIDRGMNNEPCENHFRLKQEKIFSLERNSDYVFLTLCPSCLYIVGVNPNLIPTYIQEDIIWNNKKDSTIYEKSFLESEIKGYSKQKRLNY